MIRHRFTVLFTAACLTLVGTGCLKLKPQPDLARFYVLPSPTTTDPQLAKADPAPPLPLFVSRVEIPDYLQRAAIALRQSPEEIVYSRHDYWGEPLRDGITRVLQDALSLRGWPGRIHPAKHRRPSGAYIDLQVTLTRFECTPDNVAELNARWTLVQQPDRHLVGSGETVSRHSFAPAPESSSPAIAALGSCLTDLANQIAAQHRTAADSAGEPGP